MSKTLLEILAEKTDCMYISDLRFTVSQQRIKSVLKGIEPDDFSVDEWNDAVNYLTGNTKKCLIRSHAKELILESEF